MLGDPDVTGIMLLRIRAAPKAVEIRARPDRTPRGNPRRSVRRAWYLRRGSRRAGDLRRVLHDAHGANDALGIDRDYLEEDLNVSYRRGPLLLFVV